MLKFSFLWHVNSKILIKSKKIKNNNCLLKWFKEVYKMVSIDL